MKAVIHAAMKFTKRTWPLRGCAAAPGSNGRGDKAHHGVVLGLSVALMT
ncbi:MAG: hypothetical protein GX630_01550 [Actinobacteria bacterium]|nr:hypothetical protein [Actinomycetota bacterium]